VVDERKDLSGGPNDDIIVTHVKRREEKITRIFTVYDQRDMQSGERQAQQVNGLSIIWQGETVLAGHFNVQNSQ
jgi:hypothetical protein